MQSQEFDNLINVVAKAFDVPPKYLLRKYCQSTSKARYFLCHLIYHGLPHLRKPLLDNGDITKAAYYKGTDNADIMIHESKEDLCVMNEIRSELGLPRLKDAIKHRTIISATKTLFGFDYTEEDILRMRAHIRSANEYMQKLCSIGRKPIPDGMVYSPIQKKRTYNSWYQD